MAQLASYRPQFFANDGTPLAGGKVYFYAAGTTTPQDTYTDQGGGTPNANPVVLDAYGRASIWLGSSAYKVVLKTSADVTIWTDDNVRAINVPVPVAQGGTGSTTASGARTALGLQIGVDVAAYSASVPASTATAAEMRTGTESATRYMSPALVRNATGSISTGVTTASGTSVDVCDLNTTTKRFVVCFSGVSTNGTSPIIVQILSSGTPATQNGSGFSVNGATTASTNTALGAVACSVAAAANTISGTVAYTQYVAGGWVASTNVVRDGTAIVFGGAGTASISPASVTCTVRITTVSGTDSFDAGTVYVLEYPF